MLDLETGDLDIVRAILCEHVPECEVRAYGSRVSGKARQFSDLDLVLIGPRALEWERLDALKDAFSDSDLPMIVDVHDWHAIPEGHRREIERQYEVLAVPAGDARAIKPE